MSITTKDFAIKMHKEAGSRYGNQPKEVHLKAVVEVLSDFGYRDQWADAGWLHDNLEDTATTREQLRALFGVWVFSVVEACTGIGVNRKARNKSIYRKLALFPDALIVKMAGRIANVEACKNNSTQFAMYWKEREEFDQHVALKVPYGMKKRLDAAYDLRHSTMYLG